MNHHLRNCLRFSLLFILWPVLWLQSRHVFRGTPKLPEAQGLRSGEAGQGPCCRLLIAGDSGAAGVGVSTQDQALCGQLVRMLGNHYTVQWKLLAANGLDSPGLMALLREQPALTFDVVVLSIGANDATALCSPAKWVKLQGQLGTLIESQFAPRLLVYSAVPPMHACQALPQPLRWFMGIWAKEMNRLLQVLMGQYHGRTIQGHPASTTSTGLSMDGIHPSALGYRDWATELSQHIVEYRS